MIESEKAYVIPLALCVLFWFLVLNAMLEGVK